MFSKLTKKVNTDNYIESFISIDRIKAQYNPDRFMFWKSLYEGPKGEVLNMIYSPHCRLLRGKGVAYYKMHQLYGKNDRWIRDKIKKFINLFEEIKKDGGYRNNIIILKEPLVKNKYNNGFEIFEGHHRVACCLVLGVKEINCKIIIGKQYENSNNRI